MLLSHHLASLALGAALVLAAPAPLPKAATGPTPFSVAPIVPGGATYSLERRRNPNFKRDGARDLLRARGSQGNVMTNVAVLPEDDEREFSCAVTIGGELFNMVLDTGAADIWVYGDITPSASSAGHSTLNTQATPPIWTATSGSTFAISYSDNTSVSGVMGTATVGIGGTTVNQMPVGVPTTVSSTISTTANMDGLLGMGFQQLSKASPKTSQSFFEKAAPTLAQPYFTADLLHGEVGHYGFGYINYTAFAPHALQAENVTTANGFWEVSTVSIQVGNQAIVPKNTSTIADTGTSYLLLDDAAVTAYWGQIPGAHVDESQGGWVYNCSITLPPIVVQLQNYGAEISGDLLNYQTRGNGLCLGALQSSVGLQHMILGDVFFKAHYVVFSLASPGPQLGLAPHTAGAGQAADNVANATVVDAPVPGASQ